MKLQYLATVRCDALCCKMNAEFARPFEDFNGYRSWERASLMRGMARHYFETMGWTFQPTSAKDEGGMTTLCPDHKPKESPP